MPLIDEAAGLELAAKHIDAGGAVFNARAFGAKGDGVTDDTEAIQAAWDAAKGVAGGVCYIPQGSYKISLTGEPGAYGPALHFAGSTVAGREQQPKVAGVGRGTNLVIDFPADADRTQPVIVIDKGAGTDNPRGIEVTNLLLRNSAAPAGNVAGVDYRGVGIHIQYGWTGKVCRNVGVIGFCVGVLMEQCYHSPIEDLHVTSCNFAYVFGGRGAFGPTIGGVANGISIRNCVALRIYPVETTDGLTGLDITKFPADAAKTLGRAVGAAYYIGDQPTTVLVFENANVELVYCPGYYFGSGPTAITVIGMRSEGCEHPVYARGPISPNYLEGVVFIAPSIDCDSLRGPAIYADRARSWSIINPRWYQRNVAGFQVPIQLTASSRSVVVDNPIDGDSGANGDLVDAMVDAGVGNEARLPQRDWCQVITTANKAISANATTAIQWDGTLVEDESTMWDAGTPSRVVAPRRGLYRISASILWAGDAAASGYRRVEIRVNGSTRRRIDRSIVGTDVELMEVTLERVLAKGDYVEILVRHSSTTTPLNVTFVNYYASSMDVRRIRSLS